MISNTDLASPGEDSRKHHWIRSGNISDENWCPGIDVDPRLFGELCMAELHWKHLVENTAAAGTPPEQLNIGQGFHASNMIHGHDSSTIYFWARTPGSQGIDGMSLAGMDSDNNLCFHISGRRASIMRYGSLGSPEPMQNGVLEKLEVEHHPEFEGDSWIFFALDINAEKGKVIFAVDEFIAETKVKGLKEHEYGCGSLQYVLNIGSAILLSPIRVSAHPLHPGSIQNLFLNTRPTFMHMPGPVLSKVDRLATHAVKRRTFTSPTVSITPPLLLQERRAQGSASCERSVMNHLNHRLDTRKKHTCKVPYKCSFEEEVPVAQAVCKNQAGEHQSPESFYGRFSHKYLGKDVFPDFAWGLEASVLVRDGKDVFPEEDYIDANSELVELLVPFFTGFSQTMALVELQFIFTSAKVKNKIIVHHTKIMSADELSRWAVAMVASIVLAALLLVLSLPSAFAEARKLCRKLSKALQARHNSAVDSSFAEAMLTRAATKMEHWTTNESPIEYSADTNQPDIMDAALFFSAVIILVYEFIFKLNENQHVTKLLSDIADTNWSDETTPFTDKMELYISGIVELEHLVAREEAVSVTEYAVMMVLIIRVVLFMRIHPKTAGIPSTFVRVTSDIANFLVTFAVLFLFMACAAYLRFGPKHEELAHSQVL